ncbi:14505_t:CDS:2, partial [Dentiscutata heterogama]
SFLNLTEEKLLKHPYNLVGGTAYEIAHLIELLKGEEDPRNLHEIVKNAMLEIIKEKSFEVISVSKLSLTKMNKIEKAMGLGSFSITSKTFPDTSYIECDGFKWDMDKDEDKQMQDVKDWFRIVLNLGDYSVEDVHKDTKKEVTLDKAHTILRGGFDISIGPDITGCVYIKTKKLIQELKSDECQAKGELLIANANIELDVLIVLTDLLGIIKDFVLEQGIKYNKMLGSNLRAAEKEEIKIGPLSKKAKYREVVEFCDERMFDIIPDMTDDELNRMNTRWGLRMLEKSVPINDKPIIQRYISAFSDDYENYETTMYS